MVRINFGFINFTEALTINRMPQKPGRCATPGMAVAVKQMAVVRRCISVFRIVNFPKSVGPVILSEFFTSK